MVCDLFFILFRSWVINKDGCNGCVETRSVFIFANKSRSKQNKIDPKQPFPDISKQEMFEKSSQKIFNSTVAGAR